MKRVATVVALSLGSLCCSESPTTILDAPGHGRADAARNLDGAQADAAQGFGAISGDCGVLDDTEWNTATPFWFAGTLDFAADRYDDPSDRGRLTPGGQKIVSTANAGGSSVYSEVFAYEWLARCEQATLIKTETEIVYDTVSKKADILVQIDGHNIGVSVTRLVHFPFGQPYTLIDADTLLRRKLDDIQLATTSVSAADRWSRQMLSIVAYDTQHAMVAMTAWNALPEATRDDTILIVSVTNGDDTFIYTDR